MMRLASACALLAALAAHAQLSLPSQKLDPGVAVAGDLSYTSGDPAHEAKHKLDVYFPENAKKLPVLVFFHGGSWTRGDRSQYPFLGNRIAREGYVVVVPSYRLAPASPHPAQIEDAAAAVAWVFANIAKHGGDPKKVTLAGHSAGGHLVSLLATVPEWLAAHGLAPARLRGIASLSGVYDLTGPAGMAARRVFGTDDAVRRAASPLHGCLDKAPPFLVSYCQLDYPLLPEQARQFHKALQDAGRDAKLVYVAGENHISEILSIVKDGDETAGALLSFLSEVSK